MMIMSKKLVEDIHYYSVAGTGKKPKKFSCIDILDNGKTLSILIIDREGNMSQTDRNGEEADKIRKHIKEIENILGH
jgi:hypothetical protein